MKNKRIYWVATSFVAFIMTISGALAITHAAPMMKALAHLGYPAYFSNLLGLAKLLGVSVLLTPGLVRLKEWAYVGFGITIISAAYSHWSSGDGLLAVEPLVTLAALAISYKTRPTDRSLPSSEPPGHSSVGSHETLRQDVPRHQSSGPVDAFTPTGTPRLPGS